MKQAIAGVGVLFCVAAGLTGRQAPPARKGIALSELAWPDAEAWLASSSTVVVIPLGAGALEQGPHMKLDSDERLARYLAGRVMASSLVAVAPTLTYHFYPAYADYPGSTTLGEASARDLTVDAVRSLSRAGARRFYVLNTSPSTLGPLSAAAKTLADAGILLGYTDPQYWTKSSPSLKQTPILAGHAEEAATSMMLFVDSTAVDMTRAAREYAQGRGSLTREADGRGVVSRTGILGDATLATAEKGRLLVDALVAGVVGDIDTIRTAPLPAPKAAAPPAPPPAPAPPRPSPAEVKGPGGCTAGDDRLIRTLGPKFSYLWSQADFDNLALMFTPAGDVRHPDGSIERGQNTIRENRRQLFLRREYAGSKHPLELNDIRCVAANVAIADGKWELRLFGDPQASPGRGLAAARTNTGWCTLIVVKAEGGWSIEAWRYTIDPPAGSPAPTLLAKPGYIGRGDRIPDP